jgi:hypothetical protein
MGQAFGPTSTRWSDGSIPAHGLSGRLRGTVERLCDIAQEVPLGQCGFGTAPANRKSILNIRPTKGDLLLYMQSSMSPIVFFARLLLAGEPAAPHRPQGPG